MNTQKEQKKLRCRLCGHEWMARKDLPCACPKCKRYDWEEKTITEKGEVK